MPNILILGATGYIGHSTALALLQSGQHTVYGLARTPLSAQLLQKSEITPILGSLPDNLSPVLPYLLNHSIDVIINATSAPQHRDAVLNFLKHAARERNARAKEKGFRVPKLGYVVVSGTWVHGDTIIDGDGDEQVNDLRPVGEPAIITGSPFPPAELTTWLPQAEQDYLAAGDLLNVAIVRPTLIYGRECTIWTPLFNALWSGITASSASAEQKEQKQGQRTITLPVAENARPGLIHIDDVASGILCIVNKIELLSSSSPSSSYGGGIWPIFDLVTSQESMRDIFSAAATSLGWKGKLAFAGPGDEDVFLKAMSTSFNGSSGRAVGLLGWEPKRIGMVSNVGTFFRAWVAAQQGENEGNGGWGRWEERLRM